MAPEPIFFWQPDGSWSAFLSQWFPSQFKDDENEYNTAEQYMMFQKAIFFGDSEIAQEILTDCEPTKTEAKTPKKQKGLGRKVKNFDRERWDDQKVRTVEQGNYLKFTQCHVEKDGEQVLLKDLLLRTEDSELVEASPFDRIWGIGFSPEDAPRSSRKNWGENLLGKALMNVRARLREEIQATESK